MKQGSAKDTNIHHRACRAKRSVAWSRQSTLFSWYSISVPSSSARRFFFLPSYSEYSVRHTSYPFSRRTLKSSFAHYLIVIFVTDRISWSPCWKPQSYDTGGASQSILWYYLSYFNSTMYREISGRMMDDGCVKVVVCVIIHFVRLLQLWIMNMLCKLWTMSKLCKLLGKACKLLRLECTVFFVEMVVQPAKYNLCLSLDTGMFLHCQYSC